MESATLEPPGRNFPRNFPRPCKLFTRAREHCSPATENQHTSLISTALIAKILESTEASNECETIFAAKSAMKQANLSATDSTLTHGDIPSKHSRTLTQGRTPVSQHSQKMQLDLPTQRRADPRPVNSTPNPTRGNKKTGLRPTEK